MKRGLILIPLIIILMHFAIATNGCCGEKDGLYCVYTAEESCESDLFNPNAYCDETTFCEMGCCVTDEGICAQQTGKYTCEANGGTWSEDSTCPQTECQKICCVVGNTYSYTTPAHCEALWEDYDIEIQMIQTDEVSCIELSYAQEQGCCVSLDNQCTYTTYSECENPEINLETGEGFYLNTQCSEISSQLIGLEAEKTCDCESLEDPETFCGENHKIYAYDSCGNIDGEIADCEYPNQACAMLNNQAQCIDIDCAETFKFTEEPFSNYNSYPIYYQIEKEWQETPYTFELGKEKEHGESWCIYESPTGAFQDRVGSQHYEASCYLGKEIITPCAGDRSQICVPSYDKERDRVSANCIDNNFEDHYPVDIDPIQPGENFGQYTSTPVIEGGVSTVPKAQQFWDDEGEYADQETCQAASFNCKVLYGKVKEGAGDEWGWEPYVNTICMRPEFIMLAADYCKAQGECGYNYNVLGKKANPEAFKVEYGVQDGDTLYESNEIKGGDAKIGVGWGNSFAGGNINAHDDYELFPGLDVLKESNDYMVDAPNVIDGKDLGKGRPLYDSFYGCSLRQSTGGESLDYARIMQGQDYQPSSLGETADATRKRSCTQFDEDEINGFYYGQVLDKFTTKPGFMSREYMLNAFWDLETLLIYSTAYINSEDENEDLSACEKDGRGDSAHPVESKAIRLSRVSEGLGFNVPKNTADDIHTKLCPRPVECPQPIGTTGECEDVGAIIGTNPNNMYGELNHEFYNFFTSIKPWGIDKSKLEASLSIDTKGLTIFKGERLDEGGSSELEKALDGENTLYPIQFTCNNWQSQQTNYDCSLCDTEMKDGGLVIDSADKREVSPTCNEWRCKSISNNCDYIFENEGTGRPTCIDGGCDVDYPEIFYDDNTVLPHDNVESGSTYLGYTLTDLPLSTSTIGVSTDIESKCVFVNANDIENINEIKIVEEDKEELEDNEMKFSQLEGTTTPDIGFDTQHNITVPHFEAETETIYYVWCKNYCGLVSTHFQIKLETGNAPDLIFETQNQYILPTSGSYIAADQDQVSVSIYSAEPATCRYSTEPIDNYDLMSNQFTSNQDEITEGLLQSSFVSTTSLDITDGANTYYFLCQDKAGNPMSSAEEWTVTKTDPLIISQTSPEGTLYYNDITLQVRTQQGAEQGKSTCYFKQGYQNAYIEMFSDDQLLWTQNQNDLDKGTYEYNVYCQDIAGNLNSTTIEFTVDIDTYDPIIENVHLLSNTLYIETNEATTCEYETSSFTYGDGFSASGSDITHSFSVSPEIKTYYVICEDNYGNTNSPFIVNLNYL